MAEAVGSPYIPAQSKFIIPMGIRSVLGFGGMLPTGNLFTVILFAKTPIPRETAEASKTLALNVKIRSLNPSISTIPFADAGRLALQAEQPTVAAENLGEARQMTEAALAEMRLLLYELHPPELVEEGLASALHNRLQAVESRTGLQVKFTVAGTVELSPEQEGELYKIAQEALNNVIKHAHATTVTVQLDGSDDSQCYLTIQDDGVGFTPKPEKPYAGLGLRSIYERVHQIGGDLTIHSARGAGTTVQVKVKHRSAK